jgi:hypothetical protein
MRSAFLLLFVLPSPSDAKIGKVGLKNMQVKEMNPGPCEYGNDGGGYGDSWATCLNSNGTVINFDHRDWNRENCATLNHDGGNPCVLGTCKDAFCCPGKYGVACTQCPGSWFQGDAYIEPSVLTVCSGHGNCDGDGTAGGTGACACARGYSGGGCEVGPDAVTVEEACPDGVRNGSCCALNVGKGQNCIGYHGKVSGKLFLHTLR